MKTYFKKARLLRNLDGLNAVCKQLDYIAHDLKNEPELRDEAFKVLGALKDGGPGGHFTLMYKLAYLIQKIESGLVQEGDE